MKTPKKLKSLAVSRFQNEINLSCWKLAGEQHCLFLL